MNKKSFFRKNDRIRVRVFFSMIGFSLVILLLMWLFFSVFLDDIYKAVKIRSVHHVLEILTENIDTLDINMQIEECAYDYDMCISLWSTNKNHVSRLVASKCINSGCRLHTIGVLGANDFFQAAAMNGGEYVAYFGSEAAEDNNTRKWSDEASFFVLDETYESVIFAKLAKSSQGVTYLILVNTVITPLVSVVRALKVLYMVIALVMFFLSLIISAAIAKYTLNPIEKINAKAKLLASGNFNIHFDENSYKEVADLARTLNYAAEELSTVDTTRREIIANVSHDLRTPLTLISGYAEMMRDFPNEDNTESLQAVIDEVNHMTLLVNDMTDVSKYSAGVQTLKQTEFSLTDVAMDTVKRLSKLNAQNGYTVDFEYDTNAVIYADELKITQVLYNFINNGVTHTGDDRRVVVRQDIVTHGREKYVRISVTDSGKGVQQENVKLIWDRYMKIDKTYRRAHNGSGLGLNIVKSILELHNMEYGVIPVDEMPDNKGCTFFFEAKLVCKKDS